MLKQCVPNLENIVRQVLTICICSDHTLRFRRINRNVIEPVPERNAFTKIHGMTEHRDPLYRIKLAEDRIKLRT